MLEDDQRSRKDDFGERLAHSLVFDALLWGVVMLTGFAVLVHELFF